MSRVLPFLWLVGCVVPRVEDDPDAPALPVIGLLDRADMTIGTGGSGVYASNAHPAATLPWGMVQVGPDTTSARFYLAPEHASGFHARDELVLGFSHSRPQGTSTPDTGAVLVVPSTGPAADLVDPSTRSRPLAPGSLVATPGLCRLTLDDPGIDVTLTATVRAAHHRYVFPDGAPTARLALVVGYALAGITVRDARIAADPDTGHIEGFVRFGGRFSGSSSLGAGQTAWFHARLDRPFRAVPFEGGGLGEGTSATGADAGLVLEIDLGDDPTVELQLALSYVDAAGASGNLAAELPGWDLEGSAEAARRAWAARVDPVRVSDDDPRRVRIFATALARSFLMPYADSDADGRYRGFDDEIHEAGFVHHTAFSMWDTYRTTHPLIALLHPDQQEDLNASLVQMAREGGYFPRWAWGNSETNVTVGSSADIVLADSLLAGVGGFDPAEALAFSRKMAEAPTPPGSPYAGREGITEALALGFVPRDVEDRSVSRTQEYAVADAGVAVLAEAAGEPEVAAAYRARAGAYRNLWRAELQVFAPRLSNGAWAEPLRVTDYEGQDSYYGGNARQYAWMAPHDPDGLIATWGGPEPFVAALEAFFADAVLEFPEGLTPLGIAPPLSYHPGNQPDVHTPFLFGAAGRPDLTWRWATWVAERFYDDGPDGLAGNEDSGTMSAWYVWTAIGLYPIPTTGRFHLGRPLFRRVEIDLPSGGTLVIEAPPLPDPEGVRPSVSWNGEPWTEGTIPREVIAGGGTLRFERAEAD